MKHEFVGRTFHQLNLRQVHCFSPKQLAQPPLQAGRSFHPIRQTTASSSGTAAHHLIASKQVRSACLSIDLLTLLTTLPLLPVRGGAHAGREREEPGPGPGRPLPPPHHYPSLCQLPPSRRLIHQLKGVKQPQYLDVFIPPDASSFAGMEKIVVLISFM